MTDSMTGKPSAPPRFFFVGQKVHLLALIALLVGAFLGVKWTALSESRLFGLDARVWFTISLAVPVLHQMYVWLAWRSELCYSTVTRRLGSRAFVIYQTVFMILLVARPVSLTLLVIADHDSLDLPIPVRVVLCVILGLPAAYTLYSVVRYFGMARAAGIDHFDESCRSMPLVKQGIFRYSSNSMYTFAFLALWVIAIAGASWSALVVALVSHAYIWVHYFCTERPDMKLIYGS